MTSRYTSHITHKNTNKIETKLKPHYVERLPSNNARINIHPVHGQKGSLNSVPFYWMHVPVCGPMESLLGPFIVPGSY